MRSLVKLSAAVVVWTIAVSAQARELDVHALNTYAQRALETFDVPGAAIAVVKDGAVVFSKGYGVRTLGSPAPVDPETLFAIASCSKAFTTAALAILVDEGKISWDDRVIDHLPQFRLYDPWVTREITIRDLVTHRSGFRSGGGDLLWLRSTYSRDELIERLRFLKPVRGFRSRYAYSNVMVIVAGQIIPAVTGKSWDAFVAERIFAPLNMSHANSSITQRTPDVNWATPHVFMDSEVQPIEIENVDTLGPAGAINASVSELSKWLLVQLGRGKLGETRIFSERQSKEMWSPQTAIGIGNPLRPLRALKPTWYAYGLGWRLKDYKGQKMVYHGGGLAGMTSFTTLIPEESLGIVILTNQETSFQSSLTYWILDAYLDDAPPTDWIAARQEAGKILNRRFHARMDALLAARVEGTSPSLSLNSYAGAFNDALYGNVTVEASRGQLVMRFSRSASFNGPLEHWNHDTFVVRWGHHSNADAFVTFSLGADGSVDAMDLEPFSPAADSAYDYEDLSFRPVRESK